MLNNVKGINEERGRGGEEKGMRRGKEGEEEGEEEGKRRG